MKRVDFSSVIKILLSYRNLSESFSQGEFIAELFSTFYEKSDASSDDGQVSRWANGDERVPERYAAFYSENLNSLCMDILTNIFPVLSDRWQAVNEIRDLVLFDSGIPENKKSELLCGLNPDNDYSCAEFTAKVMLFAMQRGISDLRKYSESASPVLSGMVFGCDVPKVCHTSAAGKTNCKNSTICSPKTARCSSAESPEWAKQSLPKPTRKRIKRTTRTSYF